MIFSESNQLIIRALEQTPMTFTGLKEKTKLSPSTLAEHLKKMEKKGYVDRLGDPRVIKLSSKALSPVHRALRNLATISPIVHLDIGKGAEFLTEDVVDAVLVISTLSSKITTKTQKTPRCPHPPSLECYREYEEELKKLGYPPPPEFEFDEYHLLKALARYNLERSIVNFIQGKGGRAFFIGFLSWFLLHDEEVIEFLRKEIDNPEVFPALGIARKCGVEEKINALLDWTRPLVGPIEREKRGVTYITCPKNLAGAIILNEMASYKQVIGIIWIEART